MIAPSGRLGVTPSEGRPRVARRFNAGFDSRRSEPHPVGMLEPFPARWRGFCALSIRASSRDAIPHSARQHPGGAMDYDPLLRPFLPLW